MAQKNSYSKITTVNKDYFSGSQASLFIGDIWVDDINHLEYSLSHSQTPIYGYGSQHFDFVAKGKILIQGSFTINFREPNYLWLVLSRYKKFDATRNVVSGKYKKNIQQAFNKETYENDRRKRFDYFFQTDDPQKAKEDLISQAREFDGIPENNSKENFNHSSFDILFGYGDTLDSNAVGETIRDIQIMGKSKVITIDGRPIQEVYNFIARKIN